MPSKITVIKDDEQRRRERNRNIISTVFTLLAWIPMIMAMVVLDKSRYFKDPSKPGLNWIALFILCGMLPFGFGIGNFIIFIYSIVILARAGKSRSWMNFTKLVKL